MQRSTTSYSSHNQSHKSMQPKFKECVFDSDKDPKYFRLWVRLLSGIIRNIPGGAALENFLDHYLKRDLHTSSTRPSFLDDDELALGDHATNGGIQASSRDEDDEEISVFQRDPTLFPRKYQDLLEESVELDVLLFHTLFTIVKGNYLALITDLNGDYGRYTFAIIAMWKHASLQSCNRRIEAMDSMQQLHFHGDAGKWKIDFLSRAREVYASGATIEHFIMQCAFNSFEGKNSQVQAKITEDINNDDLVRKGMNLETLASNYGSFLATLNAQKNSRMVGINSAMKRNKKKWCHKCKEWGHHTYDCDRDEDKEATSDDPDSEVIKPTKTARKTRCDYCKYDGHTKEKCRLWKRHQKEKSEKDEDASDDAEDTKEIAESKPVATAQVQDRQIIDLMKKLKSGEIKLAI